MKIFPRCFLEKILAFKLPKIQSYISLILISVMDNNELSLQENTRWTEGKKKYLAAGFTLLVALILCIFLIQYFSSQTAQPEALRQEADVGLLLLGGTDGGQNDSVSLITGQEFCKMCRNELIRDKFSSQKMVSVEATACPASRQAEGGAWPVS